MKTFAFCFLILVSIPHTIAQTTETDSLELQKRILEDYHGKAAAYQVKASLKTKTGNIENSLPEEFHNKLIPIHYNIDNYLYNDIKITTTGNASAISVWILDALGGSYGSGIPSLHVAGSYQEKIINKVHRKLSQGNYDQARQILETKTYTLTYPSVRMHIGYYFSLAMLYKYVGSYDTALQICKKGIGTLEKKPSDARYNTSKIHGEITSKYTEKKLNYLAYLYKLSGEIYHINGNYKSAMECYQKALAVYPKKLHKSEEHIMNIYNNMGNAHYGLGNYEKASRLYDKTYEILKKSKGNRLLLSETHSNKGNIFYALGDYKRALKFYKASIKRSKVNTRKKYSFKVQPYVGISNTYYALGKYQEALEFQKKAIKILEKKFGKNHQYTGLSYSKIGAIYYSLKNYKQALKYQEKAMKILSTSLKSNHLQKASVFNNLAITKFIAGKHKEAIAYQTIAIGITGERLGNNHPETIDYKLNLAKIYKAIGNYELADSLWQIIIPQTIKQQNDSYLFLPDKQRLEYLNTVQDIYANFYSFTLTHGNKETVKLATDVLLNTKSLALDYSISFREIIAQINDEELAELLEKLNTLNRQLINVEMSISGISSKRQSAASIRQQRHKLITQMLRNKELKVRLNSQLTSWQTLQSQLNPNEAIIDFLLIDERDRKSYCAIIIRENDAPLLIPLTDESVVSSIINKKDYIGGLRSRKQLYRELWQPLEAHLENVTTVYLSPSGALHKIPFEALQNEKRQYLSEHFQFHYYSSMRDFVEAQSQLASYKDAVLMGYILYDLKDSLQYKALAKRTDLHNKVVPLEGTLEEVNNIDSICRQANLRTTLLTINEPTEEVVQSLTGDNSPSIYHFATHGVFLNPTDTLYSESILRKRLRLSSNPLKRSFLLLYGANHTWTKGEKILGSKEDGILTALEVTALDLQNTDLVVLSACSTGLGNVHNTEGVFGLQRAFKLAGVNHVVASLWDVDDVATKDLMVKFYENLLKERQDPATALRNAKNYFRDKGYKPVDWAGFILIE